MKFSSSLKRVTDLRMGGVLVVALLLFLCPLFMPSFYVTFLTEIIIIALFACSLNLLMGFSGFLSFGHAAFFGIGAYTFGLLTVKAGFPGILALLCGLLLAVVVGALLAYFCVRLPTNPLYGAMLTLAAGMLVYSVIFGLYNLTGGENGLVGISRPAYFASGTSFYYFILIVSLICFIVMWILVNSPFGKTLKGIRENRERMEHMGINVKYFLFIIFVIAAFFGALSGILYSLYNNGAFPGYAGAARSLEVVFICLIGGMNTFTGPLLGALVLLILEKMIANYIEYWPAVLGVILIIVVLFFRNGILGYLEGKLKLVKARK